jgi:hypothetical protein
MSCHSVPHDGDSRNPATPYITREQRSSQPTKLEERHRKVLVEGSGIDPEVIAERGVRSVRRGRGQLPNVYSWRAKKRAPGIQFTLHRPNGETATIFRPDKADPKNPGHKYEQECKRLGGSGNVLDVHPSNRHLIDDESVTVVYTEGIKKADSITSAARAAGIDLLVVAISGVWNWMSDGEPISDMFDVPVKKGRRALIVFDSDMLRKPEVQMAAERLAQHLTQRGADLEVIYLQDQPDGSKTGADDFLAGGGTLAELLALAHPYSPGDLQQEKLSRNEELRRSLEYLKDLAEDLPAKTKRDCSKRAAWRACITKLEKQGTLVEDGIEAPIPALDGGELAHMSHQTFSACMKDFEEELRVRRIKPERREHADIYVFLVPKGVRLCNDGREEKGRGKATRGGGDTHTRVHPGCKVAHTLPEVRWSSHGSKKKRRGVVPGTRKPRQSRPAGEAQPKRRPGKKRDEVLRYVVSNDGTATKEELLERFGTPKTTWKDFKRNILPELLGRRRQYRGAELSVGPPVLELTDNGVRLVPNWKDAWAKHRILSEEREAEEKQARDHMNQRIAYRRRKETTADRAPTEEEMAQRREARQKQQEDASGTIEHEGMTVDPETGEVLEDARHEPEADEPCIHDVPWDPSMRMTRARCWLCRKKEAA